MSVPFVVVLSPLEEYQQLIVIDDSEETSTKLENIVISIPEKEESHNGNKFGNKKQTNYICNVCNKTFNNRQNISRHMIRIHKIRREREVCSKKISCNEAGCDSKIFQNVKDLKSHLEKIHNFTFSECVEQFCNLEEFLEWKKNFESAYNVSFVQHSGLKKGCVKNVIYFYCHKSGDFESQSKGIRKRKSNKVGFLCTATMKVIIDKVTNKVVIYFCNDHYGH